MKRWIHASELDDLILIKRITVTVEFSRVDETIIAAELLPLQNPDGSYDELALDYYEEFIINALEVFGEHDLVIIDEHQSPRSKSNYFSFVKEEDLDQADYKYILFIRISDHDIRQESKAGRRKFYDNKAEALKQPPTKSKQTWKFKDIIVNNARFNTYEEALADIDKRLNTL